MVQPMLQLPSQRETRHTELRCAFILVVWPVSGLVVETNSCVGEGERRYRYGADL